MTDPAHPETLIEEPRARRHDDKPRLNPALLDLARSLDEPLDATLRQARAVVVLCQPDREAVAPLALIRAIEELEARLNLLDREFAGLEERSP